MSRSEDDSMVEKFQSRQLRECTGRQFATGTEPSGLNIQLASEPPITADAPAQNFWLQRLLKADGLTEWVIDEISSWIGQNMLEIGCGIGTYTVHFAAKTTNLVSIDVEPAFVEETASRVAHFPNVQVMRGDVTSMVLPTQTRFDTVVLLDVLEHIQKDVDLLARFRPILAPGGHLILKVPAMPSLYSPMDEAIGHWRRYTKDGLSDTIQRAGYEKVDIWPFNAFGALGWWWNGCVARRSLPPAEQIALFNNLAPLIRRVDRLARLVCGSSLIAIARRQTN